MLNKILKLIGMSCNRKTVKTVIFHFKATNTIFSPKYAVWHADQEYVTLFNEFSKMAVT